MLSVKRSVAVSATGAALAIGLVATGAVGDTVTSAPTRQIKGTNTGLATVNGLVGDSAGRTYVTDSSANSVLVFGRSDNGDAGPDRVIKGTNTTLTSPEAVALDRDGYLYVAGYTNVLTFAPGASGNVAPDNTIDVSSAAYGVAVRSNGDIYVALPFENKIVVFAPEASGSATPIRTISGTNTHLNLPVGLSFSASGSLLVANYGDDSVVTFGATDDGDIAPNRLIKGAATGVTNPTGVESDSANHVYVASYGGNKVMVFAANANGNVSPLRAIAGVATKISYPWDVFVDGNRNVVVSNTGNTSITQYKPLFAFAKPSSVRSLHVSGTTRAKKRHVTWATPSSNGGTPITGYRVIAKHGTHTLIVKNVAASKHSATLKRSHLARGTDKVYVYAKNKVGYGPAAVATFHVKK